MILDFIEEHYLLIIAAVSLIVETVVLIRSFRRGSINQDAFIENLLDSKLPAFINLAESTCADGASKLSLVVKLGIEAIKKYVTRGSEQFYRKVIIEKVEAILSTPQKKEI